MTRFMDSLPVLARQGGFLVLDGAPKGNSTELPRSLRVLCHSGDGEYSLYEDGEANGQRARAVTRFQSVSGQDGSLILRLHAEDPRHLLPARSCVLELRNVEDGTVTVLENGKERVSGSTTETDIPGYTWRCARPMCPMRSGFRNRRPPCPAEMRGCSETSPCWSGTTEKKPLWPTLFVRKRIRRNV